MKKNSALKHIKQTRIHMYDRKQAYKRMKKYSGYKHMKQTHIQMYDKK